VFDAKAGRFQPMWTANYPALERGRPACVQEPPDRFAVRLWDVFGMFRAKQIRPTALPSTTTHSPPAPSKWAATMKLTGQIMIRCRACLPAETGLNTELIQGRCFVASLYPGNEQRSNN